uniref:Zinc finger GRF-type domain-containing protein n=1 Tax=Lactuca sativa TaxID=4236 RepID=A0A9R1UDP2_LACSA|nr:hypothetical protein LSAT_V11C900490670 [Lactuca sativa]
MLLQSYDVVLVHLLLLTSSLQKWAIDRKDLLLLPELQTTKTFCDASKDCKFFVWVDEDLGLHWYKSKVDDLHRKNVDLFKDNMILSKKNMELEKENLNLQKKINEL